MTYVETFFGSFGDYANYLWREITHPGYKNYFYYLIAVSLFVWLLEIGLPWRKKQSIFRKDFWLDGFYMFFNFFIFNLIIFIALSNTATKAFNDFLNVFGLSVSSFQLISLEMLPKAASLLIFFIVTDFVQWATHIMLHRFKWLWSFHQIHHSVKEMGFAAHLRYHWMETIVYKTMLYLPIAIIGGFNIEDVFIVHFMAILIGHLNHSNLNFTYGPLKYLFNNPAMHIWHHAKYLPEDRRYGVNFGISLSIWDYIFGTDYIPNSGRDIELGFSKDENYPKRFINQIIEPFKKTSI